MTGTTVEVERVVFVADLFRRGIFSPPPPPGKAKIDAIHRLLGWQLEEATGLPVGVVAEIDTERFYGLNDIERSASGWATLCRVTTFEPPALEMLRELFEGSLVVGFELPESLVGAFSALEIPYVDLVMHPVRYLDDIFLAARSGCPQVYERLLEYRLDEGHFRMHAGLFRCRAALTNTQRLEEGSLLFFGQTPVDRSLIGRGRVVALSDFKERFERLCGEHPRVYFKRHPMAKDDANELAYLESIANVERIEENSYALLARDEIEKVCAISSGTLVEARYFGKTVESLLEPIYAFAGEGSDLGYDARKFVSVLGHYFEPRFWSRILSPLVRTQPCAELVSAERPNRLRDAFNLYWAYPRAGASD